MFKQIQPRPGGLARLRLKLEANDRTTRFESRALALVASLIIIIAVGLWQNNGESFNVQLTSGVQTDQGLAIEVPTGTPGVRYFWVLH